MKKWKHVVFLPIILCSLSPGIATARDGWHFLANTSVDPNRGFHQRFSGVFEDDMDSTQDISALKLSPAQQHEARIWGLTESDEKRYVLLMHNRSGVYFRNRDLTPVEILGINAPDDTTRNLFAALDAQQESQKIAKLLAFNESLHTAQLALAKNANLPVLRPFNSTLYSPYHYQPIALKDHDQLILLLHLTNSVRPILSSLLDSISKNPTLQLNIYFVGPEITKEKIFLWASAQSIPHNLVQHKLITLNLGNKLYDSIAEKPSLPYLMLNRQSKSSAIDLGRF